MPRLTSLVLLVLTTISCGSGGPGGSIAVDARSALALARTQDGTAVLRTDDAGASWNFATTLPFAGDEIALESSSRGLLRAPFAVHATADAGATWTQVYAEPPRPPRGPSSLGGVAFTGTPGRYALAGHVRDQFNGASLESYVLVTDDAGATWRKIQSTALDTELGVLALCFTRSGRGLLAGFATKTDAESEVRALLSDDAGETWRSSATATALFGRTPFLLVLDADCTADDALWLLTESGASADAVEFTLARSRDGGESWDDLTAALPRERGLVLMKVSFADDDRGLLGGGRLGDAGALTPALFRTRDGGTSWQEVALPEGQSGTITSLAPGGAGAGSVWIATGFEPIFDGAIHSERGFALVVRGAGGAKASGGFPIEVRRFDGVAFAAG